jgi:hypothetical protein
MTLDLDSAFGLDDSFNAFSYRKISKKKSIKKGKKDFFGDKVKTLEESRDELDNLCASADELRSEIIKHIEESDLGAANKASKKLKMLNKLINIVQDEVDYKSSKEALKTKDNKTSNIVDLENKENEEDIKENIENKENLDDIILNVKASSGDVFSKAKTKLKNIPDLKKIFTPKNIVIFSIVAFSTIALVKIIK